MKRKDIVVYEEDIPVQNLPGRDLRWLFTPEKKLSEAFSMNVVIIKPGFTVKPAHSHPEKEEVVYITSGKGEAYIDGEVYDIHAGTAVLFQKKSVHMLRNTGDEDMKVACFFVPQATLADYTFHEDAKFPDKE